MMRIFVNGEQKELSGGLTVIALLAELGVQKERVAVELNLDIVPKGRFGDTVLKDGDSIEIVSFVGGGQDMLNDKLIIAGREYTSRLLVGTGKYKDFEETKKAIEASGAEIVTVAVRRVNITKKDEPNLLDYIDPKKYTILPNTAGCYTAEDAIRTCRLAREGGGWDMVKLEVLGDQKTLFPDIPATLEAAKVLVKEGFIVMAYTNDDPITAKRLEEMGCASVMPLGAPIGSGLGIRNPYNIMIILENAKVPILVDAGVGTASDAAIAMELGCDGVLMNTGIAGAKNPILMASAMKKAVEAGREAFLAGRIPKKLYATASSPIEGVIGN